MTVFLPALHSMTNALRRRLGPVAGASADPLDHPDLCGLSLRELADLPLPWPAPRHADGLGVGPGHDRCSPRPD